MNPAPKAKGEALTLTDAPCTRHLHVSLKARRRYGLPPTQMSLQGRVLSMDAAAAADWAARIGRGREEARLKGELPATERAPAAPELMAAVILHEMAHALIASLTGEGAPYARAFLGADELLRKQPGEVAAALLLQKFREEFAPAAAVDGAAEAVTGDRAAELEELLLLDLAGENPALGPLAELFAAAELTNDQSYEPVINSVKDLFGREIETGLLPGAPVDGREAGGGARSKTSLLALLLGPSQEAPYSLAEQLKVAVRLWGPLLPEFAQLLQAALMAADALQESWRAGPPGDAGPELLAPSGVGVGPPARFADDAAYMGGVVLVAKSTPVWLAQLSARYGRPLTRLDEIPDEALAELRAHGFSALWLVGVWRRGHASATIKRLRGQHDAIASAYSVHDYVIAEELGGEEALESLEERAGRYGLLLACDMVPNHTAVDGKWVALHPDWFVQVSAPPYPDYTFSGPNLSTDERMEVRIEDGYYRGTDAAVVFERTDGVTGEKRYLYHGNDGTGLPWNDTAQLDFLREEVRRAVIDETIAVAKRFPIIRLDAAMTLARQHVKRLWHPAPGEGGAIPSRAALGVSEEEFERLMPGEFWLDLTDRLQREVPGTLLLAEAFWLMEAYFVRSLGVNRVYNSAFMHLVAREENATYRTYLKEYLLEEPHLLGRFVNYMSTPDERPAALRFGSADKEFGAAALLATLPGLPLFAHGQVGGLRERYGMEFAKPRLNETPQPWHVERHEREIAPLLKRRELFSGTDWFWLFDAQLEGGAVAEAVYAFVNGDATSRTLVLYNNSHEGVSVTLAQSAPKGTTPGAHAQVSLAEALTPGGQPPAPGHQFRFEPLARGEPFTKGWHEVHVSGLRASLAPYEARAYLVSLEAAPVEYPLPEPPAEESGRAKALRPAPQLLGRRGVAAQRRRMRRAREARRGRHRN